MIDVHVHLGALPTRSNGVRVSPRLRSSLLLRLVGSSYPLHDPEATNRLYLERLERELRASTRVEGAVVLAMDGAYDSSGRLDEARTDYLVPNDCVLALGDPFLPGVSINPARRDALDELERCAAAGAALVKVLPNAQLFDPAEARFKVFYRALARLKLPLLSHVGHEYSLAGQDQSAGDPSRLRVALDEGATVIAAHACSSGLWLFEPHLTAMLELCERSNFYADVSALTLPNRVGMALRLRRHPELFARLLFGTDYPLPVLCPGRNYFDRQAAALNALGVEPRADAGAVLRPRPS